MELAVIKTGGKQYLVGKGSTLRVEKLPGDVKKGDSVTFDQVLMTDNGKAATVGSPTVAGSKVTATVQVVGRGAKIDVMKYKAKSRYLKRRGHRQPFVQVKIDKIG